MTSSPFPLLVLFIVTLIYSPLLYYLSNKPLALRQQDAFTHHSAKSPEKKPSTHHQKNPKAGAGGRVRRQSAWAGASLSCDVAFWEKREDFCPLLEKGVRIGQGRCPLGPSEQWLEETGPVVPGSPPHPRMRATVLLDPAEADTPCFPPGAPALPCFTWDSGIMPGDGDQHHPRCLENTFPSSMFISPGPWGN